MTAPGIFPNYGAAARTLSIWLLCSIACWIPIIALCAFIWRLL